MKTLLVAVLLLTGCSIAHKPVPTTNPLVTIPERCVTALKCSEDWQLINDQPVCRKIIMTYQCVDVHPVIEIK
jgi:hypothetical protein